MMPGTLPESVPYALRLGLRHVEAKIISIDAETVKNYADSL